MKRGLISLALILVAGAAPAFAGTVEECFGNTVVVTAANGSVSRFAINADHTYSVALPGGATQTGQWTSDEHQFCMTPSGGAQSCQPSTADKHVGDTWRVGDATYAIVAGR